MFQALFWKNYRFAHFGQNWLFWPKMPKNEGFSHFFAIRSLEFAIFWSLDEVVGDLRIHVRPSVRPSVRTYVTLLLENRSLLFSETLQLVRACKGGKMFQALFWKIPVLPILAKNCPKLTILAQNAQKWRFFAFFRNPFIRIC